MKQLINFLVLLLFASNVHSQKLKTYVHPTDGFEIGIPKKWVVEKPGKHGDMSLLVTGPRYDKLYLEDGSYIVDLRETQPGSLEEIYADRVIFLKQMGFEVIQIGETYINKRLYKMCYLLKSSGPLTSKYLEYFTVKNNFVFTATFIAVDKNFNKLEPLFKKIAETIKY